MTWLWIRQRGMDESRSYYSVLEKAKQLSWIKLCVRRYYRRPNSFLHKKSTHTNSVNLKIKKKKSEMLLDIIKITLGKRTIRRRYIRIISTMFAHSILQNWMYSYMPNVSDTVEYHLSMSTLTFIYSSVRSRFIKLVAWTKFIDISSLYNFMGHSHLKLWNKA